MQQPPGPAGSDALSAGQVEAWLRANPEFLAARPELYEVLEPPSRVHGPILADHMTAMLVQARRRAADAEQAGAQAAAGRRATESFNRRVQEAVLALMRGPDPAWLATHELAGLLQVDAARICAESPAPPEGTVLIPRGTIAATLGKRASIVRTAAPDAVLHGEAVALATEEALVRVPLGTGPAVLALACRDEGGLIGAGTDALAFLGQAVAAALERRTGFA